MKKRLSHSWLRIQSRLDFPRVGGSLVALCVYVLAVLVVFYPVPFRLNGVLAGFAFRDGWEHAWWPWFSRRLLLEGRGLDDLYLLNHPAGLTHPYQWSLIGFSLLSFPLASLFPPAATFNLLVLISFVLCGLAAYHLCRDLTGSHWAAVAGGGVFSFCSNRFGHALAGWLPQLTAYIYPWYALLLIRTLRRPTLRRSISLGLLAALGATIWPIHIVFFLVPLTLVIVGSEFLRRRKRFLRNGSTKYLVMALFATLTIALPFLLPIIRRRFSGGLDYLSASGVVGHSSDLLAYLTPSRYHPVLAKLGMVPSFAQRVFKDREALRAALAYPGLLAILLATWGALRTRPRAWRWVVLALSAALLALGPILVWGGEPLEYTVDEYRAHVILPYGIVRAIPFLDWVRTPGRINTTAMLGVGVLVAYGIADLLDRFKLGVWARALVSLSILACALFECLPLWPFATGDATIPPAIQYIDDQPDDGGLLHIPMSRRRVNNRALYFQTATGRPIVGGIVLRKLPQVPPWQETIEGLVMTNDVPDIVPRPDLAQRRAWLRRFDVDWALLHKLEERDETRYRLFMEELLGLAVVEDKTLAAFRVLDERAPLENARLYTLGRDGWRGPEMDADTWRRWMSNDGQLYIYSTREEMGSLRFNVDSPLDFPLLELHREGQLVDTFVVGGRTTYVTKRITLTKGMNVFRFHAPGGCPEVLDDPRCWSEALLASPEGGIPPCDARTTCRTFAFDSVSFTPEKELARGEGASVSFGDQLELRGWSLETTALHPGGTLTAVLAWKAAVKPTGRHVVFVHLLSEDGELVAQDDDAPVGSVIPDSAWPAGATFAYPVAIQLPEDLSGGRYRVLVGIYIWPSLERLPVLSDVPDAEVSTVELGSVEFSK